jgi:hypothetical protein
MKSDPRSRGVERRSPQRAPDAALTLLGQAMCFAMSIRCATEALST